MAKLCFCYYFQGEIFWLATPNEDAPLNAAPMPDTGNSSQLYLSVSDFIANTLLYNAQKHGILIYNLTKKDVNTFYIIFYTIYRNADFLRNIIPSLLKQQSTARYQTAVKPPLLHLN